MKKNIKKLVGIVCALAVSSMIASMSVSAFELPEADEAYAAINNPATTKENFEFMVATYQAQGLLSTVVYDLLSNSDADPDSMFFKLANEALDAPTEAVLGEETAVTEDAAGEAALEDAEVISTVVTSHTYAFDSKEGIVSSTANEADYGESASVFQSIKCGSKKITSILWDFVLPKKDNSTVNFAIEATSDGNVSNESVKKTFLLPHIEVNGTVTIGIVLNNWAANKRIITDPEFITTTFGYADDTDAVENEASDDSTEPVADETPADDSTEVVSDENVVEEVSEEVAEESTEPVADETPAAIEE